MPTFPATSALLEFVTLIALIGAGLWCIRRFASPTLRRWYLYLIDPRHLPTFPRRAIARDIKPPTPLRKATPRYLLYRFKFTLFMLFLNLYTYVFTKDLQGNISPSVLSDLGFSYQSFMQHKWFILVTSDFMHFNLLHLSVNMLMLLAFSGSLEFLGGSGLAAITYLVAMNSNVPNGLLLLPLLRVFFPELWMETLQFVDVGASLGIIGSLGGLSRLLVPSARWLILTLTVGISLGAALVRHELIGIDHAFSAVLGYLAASYYLRHHKSAMHRHETLVPFPIDRTRPAATQRPRKQA